MLSVEFDAFYGFNFSGVISDGDSRCGLHVGYKQERLKKTFQEKLLTPSLKSTATSSTLKSLGSGQCTLSEISFPNGERNLGCLPLHSRNIDSTEATCVALGDASPSRLKACVHVYEGSFLAEKVRIEAPSELSTCKPGGLFD